MSEETPSDRKMGDRKMGEELHFPSRFRDLLKVGIVPKYPTLDMTKCRTVRDRQGNSLQFGARDGLNCNPDNTEQAGHFAIQHFILTAPYLLFALHLRRLN